MKPAPPVTSTLRTVASSVRRTSGGCVIVGTAPHVVSMAALPRSGLPMKLPIAVADSRPTKAPRSSIGHLRAAMLGEFTPTPSWRGMRSVSSASLIKARPARHLERVVGGEARERALGPVRR